MTFKANCLKHAALALALGCIMTSGSAMAGTVSFTFTQGGWTTGSLTGSFSGTPEANGVINLADLSSFSATFNDANGTPAGTFLFQLANLEAFSYNTANAGSLEFAGGFTPTSIVLCSGAAESAKVCGATSSGAPVTGPAPTVDGFFVDVPHFGPFITDAGPQVADVASAVPEPGTAPLLSCFAAGLLLLGSLRKRVLQRLF